MTKTCKRLKPNDLVGKREATGAASLINAGQDAPAREQEPGQHHIRNNKEMACPSQNRFPTKLMSIIDNQVEYGNAIRWSNEGTIVGIFPDSFAAVLEKHFQGTKFESFTRKLSRWGFQRVLNKHFPPGAVAYQNEMFQRARPDLLPKVQTNEQAQKNQPGVRQHDNDPGMPNQNSLPANDSILGSFVTGGEDSTRLLHDPSNQITLPEIANRGHQQALHREPFGNHGSVLPFSSSVFNPATHSISRGATNLTDYLVAKHRMQARCEIQEELVRLRYQNLQRRQRAAALLDQVAGLSLPLVQQTTSNEMLQGNWASLLSSVRSSSLSLPIELAPQPTLNGPSLRGSLLASALSNDAGQSAVRPGGIPGVAGQSTAASRMTAMRPAEASCLPSFCTERPSNDFIRALRKRKREADSDTSNEHGTNSLLEDSHSPKPISSFQQQQWDALFNELKQYRKKHGNCLVPQHNYHESPQLARWVKRQRYQYKLMRDGKPSNMTLARAKALEAIDFIWDSHSAVWQERLNELKEFRRVHSHCNIPSNDVKNPRLASWVKCQRRQYKLHLEGNSSNMTPYRIQALEAIGFEWQIRKYSS